MNTFDIYAYFDNRQVYAINGSYVETSSVYSANI